MQHCIAHGQAEGAVRVAQGHRAACRATATNSNNCRSFWDQWGDKQHGRCCLGWNFRLMGRSSLSLPSRFV